MIGLRHKSAAGAIRAKRRSIGLLLAALLLGGAALFAFHLAVQLLKGRITSALGPGSQVAELKVGWSSVELIGLAIEAPKGWPAARALHAERVRIVPSLSTLLTDRIQISSITIERPYLAVLRTPGRLLMVPTFLEARRKEKNRKGGAESAGRTVWISRIALEDGTVEVFDATIAQPPLKIRLERIEALVRDLATPPLTERVRFDLTAVAKGATRDGRVKISGWVAAAGRDSSSRIILDKVDLVSLQPYLVKRGEAKVSRGTLDLDLKSEVRNNRLDGKGKMIIKGLEFAPHQSYLDTFMGIPRNAVISFLKDHDGAIDMDFSLAGDVSHPKFSLNETLATRVASAMAGQLGVTILGVAEGIETIGRKGLEGVGGVAEAIGSVFKGLLGGGEKR